MRCTAAAVAPRSASAPWYPPRTSTDTAASGRPAPYSALEVGAADGAADGDPRKLSQRQRLCVEALRECLQFARAILVVIIEQHIHCVACRVEMIIEHREAGGMQFAVSVNRIPMKAAA